MQIVQSAGKEGMIPFLDPSRPPERLVWLCGEVHVVPRQPLVLSAHQHMVPAAVHSQAGDGPTASQQLLGQLLLGKVVHADLRDDEAVEEQRLVSTRTTKTKCGIQSVSALHNWSRWEALSGRHSHNHDRLQSTKSFWSHGRDLTWGSIMRFVLVQH